jgi:adenosine deaminase
MLGDDPVRSAEWVSEARERGLHFEVCPSSNVHTGAVASLAQHPIRAMLEAGLSVSCSTDNRLMSNVTLSGELQALHEQLGMSHEQLGQLMRNAVAASFLPIDLRNARMTDMQQWNLDA